MKKDICFYAVVFAVFYVLCSFNFMNGDDFLYCFKYYNLQSTHSEPITSLADVLESQAYDYMKHSGRVIVHAIVQLFCGIWGMEVFRFFNSIVFVALCVGCVTMLRRLQGRKAADAVLVVFALFVLVPEMGNIFMGPIPLCVNYLWAACAVVWFLVIYDKTRQKDNVSPVVGVALFLMALVVGSLQESFTISLSGAMFFYYAFHLRKFRGPVVWLVLGLWLGTAIVTLAPGNFVRLAKDSNGEFSLGRVFTCVWKCLAEMRMTLLLIVILLGIGLYDRRSLKEILRRNQLTLLIIFVSLAPVVMTYTGVRQITCAELFSIVLLLRLLYDYCGKFLEHHRKVVHASLCLLLLLLCIPVYGYRRDASKAYEEMFNAEVKNGALVAKEYQKQVKRWMDNKNCLYHNTSSLFKFEVWIVNAFSLIRSGGNNGNLIKAVLPETPETLDEKFRQVAVDGVYNDAEGGYLIIKGKDGILPKCTIEVRSRSFFGQLKSKITGKNTEYYITDQTFPFSVGDVTYGIFYEGRYDVIACEVDGRTVQLGKESQ